MNEQMLEVLGQRREASVRGPEQMCICRLYMQPKVSCCLSSTGWPDATALWGEERPRAGGGDAA